jgi:flagella basal body P-ring formation protein FlgA
MRRILFVVPLIAFATAALSQSSAPADADSHVDPRPGNSIALSFLHGNSALRPLRAEEMELALRKTLGPLSGEASVTIVDFSKIPVPPGEITFSLDGAALPMLAHPDRPFLWRGRVTTTVGIDVRCWVYVKVVSQRQIVRTKVALLAGQLVQAEDIEQSPGVVCPLLTPSDDSEGNYVGHAVKRSLRAFTVMNREMVVSPPLIKRGARVQVAAIAGKARVSFEAEAHSDGRQGQRIELSNIRSGKVFWGVVNGDGSVLVEVPHRDETIR